MDRWQRVYVTRVEMLFFLFYSFESAGVLTLFEAGSPLCLHFRNCPISHSQLLPPPRLQLCPVSPDRH